MILSRASLSVANVPRACKCKDREEKRESRDRKAETMEDVFESSRGLLRCSAGVRHMFRMRG